MNNGHGRLRHHAVYRRHQRLRWYAGLLIIPYVLASPIVATWMGMKSVLPEIVDGWQYIRHGCQCSACINYRRMIINRSEEGSPQ